MKTNSVEYVYFDQLDGASEFLETRGTFDSFSYGDAALTLVNPDTLLEDVDESEFPTLHETLTKLHPETLIGFNC